MFVFAIFVAVVTIFNDEEFNKVAAIIVIMFGDIGPIRPVGFDQNSNFSCEQNSISVLCRLQCQRHVIASNFKKLP